MYHHDCWWNFHEIPWNPMEIPLSHCQIVPLETRFCFLGWGAEDDLTLTNLRPRSRGSMWMWQSRSVANQLKRPSYRDMSSYTKLYISRYTLAYYAHICTSRHYVHHLRSGAVYAVHNLHIRRRFTNMTYHSEWSPEDGQKIIVLPGASLLSFRARGTLLQPVVWPGIILRHTHLLPNDAKVSDCCFIDRK